MKVWVLFTLQLLLSDYCAESKRNGELIADGSGQMSSWERVLDSGKIRRCKKIRERYLRRRERMAGWCFSKMKAKEIDNEARWKKITGATAFLLGIVHLVYFCHPLCNHDENLL